MKLYYSPGACSLASHIALEEAKLPYTAVKVDLAARRTADGGDYLAINAKGYVPALVLDDGGTLTENAIVLQYIADQSPGSELAPAHGTFARYKLGEWLNFIASELHKGFGPLWNAKDPEEVKDAARRNLGKRFAYADKRLAATPFLMGDTFTVADAYLFVMLDWTDRLKVDLAPLAALKAYRARVASRPAVQKAMRDEGLTG
ncbi:MAG TPA: glutathione transferase GstA [Casimicrobiaceae bacterium]|nr:glutathione transferase GstA [Casimicrobiaceae bacterium]